jgi:hypothetical protein
MRPVLLVGCLVLVCLGVQAQPFTYQGMLKQSGLPANGTFSMTFKLYNALTGGTAQCLPRHGRAGCPR